MPVQEHGGGLLVLVEELGQALGDEVPADGAARCAAVRIAARRGDASRAEIAARIRPSSSDASRWAPRALRPCSDETEAAGPNAFWQ